MKIEKSWPFMFTVVAIVAGVIALLGGFDWWPWAADHDLGWLGLSLTTGWAARIP